MDWFHPGLTGPDWFQWTWIRQGYRPSPEAQRWVWNKIGLLWVLQPTQLFSKAPLQKYRKISLHSRLSPKLNFPESWIFYVCSRTSSYSPLPLPWKLSYYFSKRNRAFVTTWESICLESREQSWSKVWGWARARLTHWLTDSSLHVGLIVEVLPIQTSAKCLPVMNLGVDPKEMVT